MKLCVGLILCLAFVVVQTVDIEAEWAAFKDSNNRVFTSPEMEQYRKDNFIREYEKVEKHNERFRAGTVSFELKLNEKADWSLEEKRDNKYVAYYNPYGKLKRPS